MTSPAKKKECCPKFDPKPWEGKFFEWKNKRFIKGRVFTLFHIPFFFGVAIKGLFDKVEKAGATLPDTLCLSDHTSPWNMDLYLAVDKEVAGAENVTLSGKYVSKVYEGDFKEPADWCEDFKAFTMRKGCAAKKLFMWYTTCTKCAKKFGKNYVVLVAEVLRARHL